MFRSIILIPLLVLLGFVNYSSAQTQYSVAALFTLPDNIDAEDCTEDENNNLLLKVLTALHFVGIDMPKSGWTELIDEELLKEKYHMWKEKYDDFADANNNLFDENKFGNLTWDAMMDEYSILKYVVNHHDEEVNAGRKLNDMDALGRMLHDMKQRGVQEDSVDEEKEESVLAALQSVNVDALGGASPIEQGRRELGHCEPNHCDIMCNAGAHASCSCCNCCSGRRRSLRDGRRLPTIWASAETIAIKTQLVWTALTTLMDLHDDVTCLKKPYEVMVRLHDEHTTIHQYPPVSSAPSMSPSLAPSESPTDAE